MATIDQELPQPKQAFILGNASYSPLSTIPPPPFEQSAGDPVILDFSQHETYTAPGGEDPPEFAPYDASYFISGAGDVISHGPHLNEDGEALYRFLLSQAVRPPRVFLHCRGSHEESHTRLVRSRQGSHSDFRTEQYTERVVDFDFKIDVGQHIFGEPTHWSVGNSVPAYRGRMFPEVGIGGEKRKAERAELKLWNSERNFLGHPPWTHNHYAWREDQLQVTHGNSMLESPWTLRQWADDYCSSRKFLKEFEYRKVVYGWNFDALKVATRDVIFSTRYRGDLDVSFDTSDSIISVRSHNYLSRALSNGWIKFLLMITFIYPFLWLFRRFHPRGGGIWRVCGGGYSLTRVEQVTHPQECAEYPGSPFPDARPAEHSRGLGPPSLSEPHIKVWGLREGIWFRQWEGTIRRAVVDRLQESDPLVQVDDDRPTSPTVQLDGYYDLP